MEEGDDLYDDLDNVQMEKSSLSAPNKSKSTIELEKQIEVQQARVAALEKENETLRRNMGTLFRTARTEMERKDAEIKSLSKQINQ